MLRLLVRARRVQHGLQRVRVHVVHRRHWRAEPPQRGVPGLPGRLPRVGVRGCPVGGSTVTEQRYVLLHDDENTAITMREQRLGRVTGICSVCESGPHKPWELDDSGRCEECRP